ncbi:MAG: Rne/Rng family ribonuclease [Candidatus Dependentiae bacterium]|nr:Rne/Rng family ribonuclease [Candidatus Dependentiae bacterium]
MKKIIINYNPWQTRIAITYNDRLENIYFSGQETLERAYFKGKVSKVLPGIQTAFVDIGQDRAGFLHISEIDRDLAIERIGKNLQMEDDDKIVPKKSSYEPRDISKILKEGDPILVQVSKEPVYEKGAKLTTCFTLPGRFIVLMPNIPRIGVSKKIADVQERNRLKDLVRKQLPEGMGCIIRTTAEEQGDKEIIKDIKYLLKTWYVIEKNFDKGKPQQCLHEDLDLSLQIVRDFLDDNVSTIITDDKQNQTDIYQFIKIVGPEHAQKVKLYTGKDPIFDFFDIEAQIEEVLEKKVDLKSGGSLIVETTEAMTVIDVNTGKFIGKKNLEDTIFKTNLEAAEEVARQLRLRNIGGLIVIDFIDMAMHANRQKLFQFFEKTLKERDKFQSVVLKVSEFGLVQMTRKRSGKTLLHQLTDNCPECAGAGHIKSIQTESFAVLRDIKHAIAIEHFGGNIIIGLNPALFDYVTTVSYNAILEFEKTIQAKITLKGDTLLAVHEYTIEKM